MATLPGSTYGVTRIRGLEETLRKVDAIPVKMRGKARMDAAEAGAEIYRDAARQNAPQGSVRGKLRRDIRYVVTDEDTDNITVGISWRVGRASRTPAFYGLFVHKGTKPRTRKNGGSTGAVTRPNRFLDKAFDEKKEQAERAVAISLRRSLLKAVRSG